ncbi:MAG TPA: type II toxin-antitoxin system HicB family antitoxin [Candidatus Paceibacterota bacterium]
MLNEYIEKKLVNAKYKKLRDGSFFAEIPELKGVWANAKNIEKCRQELREVVEGWLLLKVHDHEKVPGFMMSFNKRQSLSHA